MANKALLVGINKYMLPGSDFQGCVNDITNIGDILLKYYRNYLKLELAISLFLI